MHPKAGGAEYVTRRIASGLVERGHDVTWFASRSRGLPAYEVIDGVRVVRRASQATVHAYFAGWLVYQEWRGRRFDVVVDQVNTIPFLAHMVTRTPTIAFIHQLAREVWFKETMFPLGIVGYILESVYLRVYGHTRVITDSNSSAKSFRSAGMCGETVVIPLAVDPPRVTARDSSMEPETLRLVVTARLVASKRIDHALRTVALLHRRGLPVTIDLVGNGNEHILKGLRELARGLGIGHLVTFHGRLATDARDELVAGAFACIATSVREGWGLSITEANVLGVPGAVYPVAGLCDSTVHGRTGVISASATPPALADAIEALWRNRAQYLACREGARAFAAELTWDRTVDAFEHALLQAVG
jgi:glycosyltransferase involved in cell wall biosynthesis